MNILVQVVHDAWREGYNLVGFSGGEPLLYPSLPEVSHAAAELGMFTTVTTNGLLITASRLAALSESVHLLAISLDGIPSSHDRIRGRRGAFNSLVDRLELVRRSGIPFGFIFTLTQHNVHELTWVAQFAASQGARLLQIHPLEEVGRARSELQGCRPDDVEMAFAYLQAIAIQTAYADRLTIHVDLVDLDVMKNFPERVFADSLTEDADQQNLADLVSPLVVQADGLVVPLQFGFSDRFALGNLYDKPLVALSGEWKREKWWDFRDLCQSVYHTMCVTTSARSFGNWYEVVTAASHHPAY